MVTIVDGVSPSRYCAGMVRGISKWVPPSHGVIPPPPGRWHHACVGQGRAGWGSEILIISYPYYHDRLIRAAIRGGMVVDKLPWGGDSDGVLLIMHHTE